MPAADGRRSKAKAFSAPAHGAQSYLRFFSHRDRCFAVDVVHHARPKLLQNLNGASFLQTAALKVALVIASRTWAYVYKYGTVTVTLKLATAPLDAHGYLLGAQGWCSDRIDWRIT